MAIETLTGLNRVAILLICLGEEAASRIFDELSDDEVRQVTRVMATIDHIPITLKERVFANYYESQNQFKGIFVKGEDFDECELMIERNVAGRLRRVLEGKTINEVRQNRSNISQEFTISLAFLEEEEGLSVDAVVIGEIQCQ